MSDKQLTIDDANNYYALSKPFDSPEAAEAAVKAFWEEFYALRNKYRLADVYVILSVTVRYEDGRTGTIMTSLNAGDDLRAESMVSWALGRESAERQERMARLIEQTAAVRVPRKKN